MKNDNNYKIPNNKKPTLPASSSSYSYGSKGSSGPGASLLAPSREERRANRERQASLSKDHLGSKIRGANPRRTANFLQGGL